MVLTSWIIYRLVLPKPKYVFFSARAISLVRVDGTSMFGVYLWIGCSGVFLFVGQIASLHFMLLLFISLSFSLHRQLSRTPCYKRPPQRFEQGVRNVRRKNELEHGVRNSCGVNDPQLNISFRVIDPQHNIKSERMIHNTIYHSEWLIHNTTSNRSERSTTNI